MSLEADDLADQYATEAVESVVRDAQGEPVGHVGLFDLDGSQFGEAVEAARSLPGPVAVLSSGPGAHHLWALAVLPISRWHSEGEALPGADADHVALSERREAGVLRTAPKIRLEDGEAVRPAPRFEDAVGVDRLDLGLSRPHYRTLREELGAEIPALEDPAAEWAGHSHGRRTYMAEIGGR